MSKRFAIDLVSEGERYLQKKQKDYLHAVKTSSSRSVSCIFGIVLLLEREPRRQVNADLKMANETRVLIHAIVEA